MAHNYYHCGTAGEDLGEKSILIYDGSAMNIALAIKTDGLRAYGLTDKQIQKLVKTVDKSYRRIVHELKSLGVPYVQHEPHAQNIEGEH